MKVTGTLQMKRKEYVWKQETHRQFESIYKHKRIHIGKNEFLRNKKGAVA